MNNKVLQIVIFSMFCIFFTTCLSTTTSRQPTITIVNNTGYNIHRVYFSNINNTSWGGNCLRSNQIIRNGDSVYWYFSDGFTVGERCDIRIVDSSGFTYTRANITLSENIRFVFTINHADARYFQENFTPYFLWSTGTSQQNARIRTVSITNARTEILRLYKLYNRMLFNWDSDYHTRASQHNEHINYYNKYQRENNQALTYYHYWVDQWFKNHNQFAYAYISELPDFRNGRINWFRSVMVKIVKGNEVVYMQFLNIDPVGHGFPTTDNNRRVLDDLLNRFLN